MKRLNLLITAFLCSFFINAALFSQVRVACIGNSITYGATIKNRSVDSYPAQLGRILGPGWEVKNFGVSGSTLLKKGNKPYINQKAYQEALDYQPNIVVIKLGTNDSKPDNWKYKSEFESNYIELVKTFKGLKTKPEIWLCLPVPCFETKWGINDSTIHGEIIPLVKKVARKTRSKLIDLYTPLTGKPEMFNDGIHPNPQGAGIMAKEIASKIRKN